MKKVFLGYLGALVLLLLMAGAALFYFGPNYNIYLLPPSPQQYVKSALGKMSFGLYAGKEWEEESKKALEEVKIAKNYEETYPVLKRMAELAGGKHSYFYSPKDNRLIRRLLPKGSKDATLQQVAFIENWMNNYPKKILDHISLREFLDAGQLGLKVWIF